MPTDWLAWDVHDVVRGLAHRLDPERLAVCRDTIDGAHAPEALVWVAGLLVGAQVPLTAQEHDRIAALTTKAGIRLNTCAGIDVLKPIRGDHATFRLSREVLSRVASLLQPEEVNRVRSDLDAGRWTDAIAHFLAALARGKVPVAGADRDALLRLASSCGVPVSAVAAVPAAFNESVT